MRSFGDTANALRVLDDGRAWPVLGQHNQRERDCGNHPEREQSCEEWFAI